MAFNAHTSPKGYLPGNPYVFWSPRPAKNGQPPPCYGQCNINIGTRKVGAAMKRLPQIFMGPKSKEQILQKWDPVSRTIVNVRPPRPDAAPAPPGAPDTPCSSQFPGTTFFVVYTNNQTFIPEGNIEGIPPFTLFPNQFDTFFENSQNGKRGVFVVPTDSVTTRQLLSLIHISEPTRQVR
jgi:hypothetical protein